MIAAFSRAISGIVVAEQVLVIERDIGHGRDPEVEDVGAVEPATEPDLADQHLGVRLARGEDPRRGEHLEPGRLQLLGERPRLPPRRVRRAPRTPPR